MGTAFRISLQPDWQFDNGFLTGQSWRVLKSRYTGGDPEQEGFRINTWGLKITEK